MAGLCAVVLILHTYSQRWHTAAGELELQDPHLIWVAGVEDRTGALVFLTIILHIGSTFTYQCDTY